MYNLSDFPKMIQTERLVLRVVLPTKTNAQELFKVIEQNRAHLEKWQQHFITLVSVDAVLAKIQQRYNQIATNEGILFGIYKGNNLIGRIRFSHIKDKGCKIGYWLIKSENGHGYMTEALTALETELFKFGFTKVILDIDSGNTKSKSVAERNGYQMVKQVPNDTNSEFDLLLYQKTYTK